MSYKNIIVSPSGQLYGSENVLFDFLIGSASTYEVYVPANSAFYQKLKNNDFNPKGYKNLKWLYLKIFLKILFFHKSLYLNEAGHISYVKFIARFLPSSRKFVVSIRLVEDCNKKLIQIPINVVLISVSNFIKDQIETTAIVKTIYDPYKISALQETKIKSFANQILKVGIVGRITESKGVLNILPIMKSMENEQRKFLKLKFFGTYDENDSWLRKFKTELDSIENCQYYFEGFEKDKSKLYDQIDLLLHLNKEEPLGRILFEAIEGNVAFLCFNKGGIGELCSALGLEEFTVLDNPDWAESFASRISIFTELKKENITTYDNAVKIIEEKFNPDFYASRIEKFL